MKPRRRVPVREYSREFDMTRSTRRAQIAIDVPAAFHRSVRAKAKREGKSIRSLVLGFLQTWAEGEPANAAALRAVAERLDRIAALAREKRQGAILDNAEQALIALAAALALDSQQPAAATAATNRSVSRVEIEKSV